MDVSSVYLRPRTTPAVKRDSRTKSMVPSKKKTITKPVNNATTVVTKVEDNTNKFFGSMMYNSTKCDHGDAIGTDLHSLYMRFHAADFFETNKIKFNNGVPLAAVHDSARQLAATMIKSFLDVTFDNYYQQLLVKEQIIRTVDHYELFTAAAYNTIYAHTTAFYGLKDLFKDHRVFVQQFVQKFGCSFEPKLQSRKNMYDNILLDAMNNSRQNQVNKKKMVDHLCDLFQTSFNRLILPDIAVIRSIYIYRYLGQIDNDFDYHYMNENLRKTGCGYRNHNAFFTIFNDNMVSHIPKINMDFTKYHQKRKPPPRHKHVPMVNNINHQQFGQETDSREPGIFGFTRVTSRLIKNEEVKPSLQSHLLMVNIWNHHEEERQIKMGMVLKVNSLKNICQNRLTISGGHDLKHLQPAPKLNQHYMSTPIQFDLFTAEFKNMSIWCQAMDLKVQFLDDMNFVLFSNKPPILDRILPKYHQRFQGPHAIIAYGDKVWIYNHKYHPNYFVHRKNFDIILSDHNFMIWSQNLFPLYLSPYQKSHNLLHFGNDEGYNNVLRGMEHCFVKIGFGRSAYFRIRKMVEDYYWFGW